MEKSILDVLQYFSFFNYPPNSEEIYAFLKKKASKGQITIILEKLEKRSLIKAIFNDQFSINNEFSIFIGSKTKNLGLNENLKLKIANSYKHRLNTPPQYIKRYYKAVKKNPTPLKLRGASNEAMKQWDNRQQISIDKLNSWKFKTYLNILRLFPQIKLVGLSGSVAMLNADEDHDIDLFIITAKNRLWTGRFIAVILAKLLGIHRSYHHQSNLPAQAGETPLRSSSFEGQAMKQFSNIAIQQYNNSFKDRICLNLFFDQSNLVVPKFKRTEYVAHEVLQMKPLIDKNDTYLSFIDANRWVFDIFPNASSKFKVQSSKLPLENKNLVLLTSILNFALLIFNLVTDKIENMLKSLQLASVKRHQTNEFITDQQLWFHPDDFEKKLMS